ncbi:MAG: hypothetical protein GXO43_01630 [Crenarchaeota archaeon]|nr:hypothetical protein [Thermoproteota archaeon]
MIVKDNRVVSTIDCTAAGKQCFDVTPTLAQCRTNKPTAAEVEVDQMYKKMYGNTQDSPLKEFLLFGAGGLGATLVSSLGRIAGAGDLATALRDMSFWRAILGSIAALGVSYLMFRAMPDDCRAKPFVGVLAPLLGLVGGAVTVVAVTGIGFLLCMFGGKKMKM